MVMSGAIDGRFEFWMLPAGIAFLVLICCIYWVRWKYKDVCP